MEELCPSCGIVRATLAAGVALFLGYGVGVAAESTRGPGLQDLDPALAVGARVSVKGELNADGILIADEIEVQSSDDDDEELQGRVRDFDPERGTFTLVGSPVRLRSGTRYSREPQREATVDDLRDGLWVKVDGERDASGVLKADKLRISRDQQLRGRVKVEGPITSLEPADIGLATMRVAGVSVRVGLATELVGKNGRSRPVGRRLGSVDDDEELLFTRHARIGRHVAIAGEARLRAESLSNLDLDDEVDHDLLVPEIAAQVGLAARFGPAYGYVTFVGTREFVVSGSEPFESGNSSGRIGEAYIQTTAGPRLSLAIGRQRFNEEREWYFNTRNLDALRLFVDLRPVELQISYSRDLFDVSRNLRDQNLGNLIVQASYPVTRDIGLEAYWIDRDDKTYRDDSPLTVGLRLLGDPGRRLEFWADLAYQGGTACEQVRRSDANEPFDSGRACGGDEPPEGFVARDVQAHALDLGLTYRPRIALDPTFTVGYALGSGEDDTVRDLPVEEAATTTAGSFRQTGLHRNRWRFNGVVSFRYYGEVLDPNLTNLGILTLGVGLRPARGASIDLIYHDYTQDEASKSFHEFEVGATPSGESRDIGEELDLALGYEPTRRYELRLTAGLFRAGAALDSEGRTASAVRFQAKFRF